MLMIQSEEVGHKIKILVSLGRLKVSIFLYGISRIIVELNIHYLELYGKRGPYSELR